MAMAVQVLSEQEVTHNINGHVSFDPLPSLLAARVSLQPRFCSGVMASGSASVAGGSCSMSALPKLPKQPFQPKEIFPSETECGLPLLSKRVVQQVEVAPL